MLFSRDEKCRSRNEDLTRFASTLMFYCQYFIWLQTHEIVLLHHLMTTVSELQ